MRCRSGRCVRARRRCDKDERADCVCVCVYVCVGGCAGGRLAALEGMLREQNNASGATVCRRRL
jgi:hypothetical protein